MPYSTENWENGYPSEGEAVTGRLLLIRSFDLHVSGGFSERWYEKSIKEKNINPLKKEISAKGLIQFDMRTSLSKYNEFWSSEKFLDVTFINFSNKNSYRAKFLNPPSIGIITRLKNKSAFFDGSEKNPTIYANCMMNDEIFKIFADKIALARNKIDSGTEIARDRVDGMTSNLPPEFHLYFEGVVAYNARNIGEISAKKLYNGILIKNISFRQR